MEARPDRSSLRGSKLQEVSETTVLPLDDVGPPTTMDLPLDEVGPPRTTVLPMHDVGPPRTAVLSLDEVGPPETTVLPIHDVGPPRTTVLSLDEVEPAEFSRIDPDSFYTFPRDLGTFLQITFHFHTSLKFAYYTAFNLCIDVDRNGSCMQRRTECISDMDYRPFHRTIECWIFENAPAQCTRIQPAGPPKI